MTADARTLHWSRRRVRAALGAASVLVALAPATARAASAPYVPGVVVVGLQRHVSVGARDATLARAGIDRDDPLETDIRQLRLRRGVSVQQALARLRGRPGVAWAVPDYIAHAADATAPDPLSPFSPFVDGLDLPAPFYPDDPGTAGTPGGWEQLQWNFDGQFGVGAPQAWANLIADGHPGGEGVTVAVLDTGVAYARHGRFVRSPDFSAAEFVRGYDFVAHSPYPEDRDGHGTQVAGTIAEQTDNAIGVTGLAYGVRLMPVRVLDAQGNGDATTIAQGIIYAVKRHAQIINLSLEFTAGTISASDIPQLIAAIDYAHSKNVLVVAAAGNEGIDQLAYPAKARFVLAVGATTDDGCLADYSDYGSGLGLVAPGGGDDMVIPADPECMPQSTSGADVYQETFADLTDPNPDVFGVPAGYYGTSMATPHVTAAAALVIASGVLGPHPTVAQIIARLESTATPLGGGAHEAEYFGAGLVNAAAATAPAGSTGGTGTSGTTGTTGTT